MLRIVLQKWGLSGLFLELHVGVQSKALLISFHGAKKNDTGFHSGSHTTLHIEFQRHIGFSTP